MATPTLPDIRRRARRAAHEARMRPDRFQSSQLSRLSRRLHPWLTLSEGVTGKPSLSIKVSPPAPRKGKPHWDGHPEDPWTEDERARSLNAGLSDGEADMLTRVWHD